MKKITDIRAQLKKLEENSKKLHNLIFETFKEATKSKDIDYSVQLRNDFIYSIACGTQRAGFYPYVLLYMDGQIDLYSTSFGRIVTLVASWKSIETFKNEIATCFD